MGKKIAILAGIFFVFGIAGSVFAQEDSAGTKNEEVGAPVETQPALITSIEIKGNKSISSNTIISKMKSRVGNPYQENIISDDLKRLYLLGFFSDIKIDTEKYQEGIKVIVTVAERPIIEKITFEGMKRVYLMKEEKLRESLKSKESQYLDYPTLAEDVQMFKKQYEKKGFSDAKIDYRVDVDPQTNKAKVAFAVEEDKRIRIKNISIEGNAAFSDRRILRLMKTKKAWLIYAGTLKEDVLSEDIERIKSFYQRRGFADVIVTHEVVTDPKKPVLFVIVRIQEGKKYLVGNVTIRGNKDISEKDILEKLKACVPDKVFSQDALKEDVGRMQGLYFDRGYIFMQVQDTTTLNASTNRIDISYTILENEVAYVDKIKIRGNVKTKDIVIRRELKVRPGDRFDGEKLRRSKERLSNLGFFEEVSYDTQEGREPNKKDLVVEVKESKTGAGV